MSCVYIIYDKDGNVSREMTYLELVKAYRDGNYRDISDILYSKGSKQDAVFSLILKDKHDFKVVLNENRDNGEPDYSDGKLTTLTLIDSGQFTIRGERPIPQESDEEYIQHVTQAYVDEGLSEEEAKNRATLTVQNWKIINEDAKELHRLLNSFSFLKEDRYDFIKLLEGTKFENNAASIYDLIMELNGVFHIMRARHKLDASSTVKIIQAVNLLAKINGSGDDLIGHIDNLVIDTDGVLHIYNYKITSNPVSEMTKGIKFDKYRYLLALLKQILAYNGYNVSDTTLHIIPIRLTYNDDFSQINETAIYASNHILLPQGASFSKYETIAKHFVKSNITINPISSTIISKINLNLESIFPERAVNYKGILQSVDEWIKYNYSTKLEARIKKVDAPDHVYELYLDDSLEKAINITNPDKPLENEDIRREVTKYLKEENSNNSTYLRKLINDIRVSYRQQKSTLSKNNFGNRNSQLVGSFLDKSLSKYIRSVHKEGDKDVSDWDLISDDTLLNSNILVFKHYKTELIDVVTLSDYTIRAVLPTSAERTNIMGYFLRDSNKDTKGLINYKQSFANIEAVRTMVVLNEILPQLTSQNLKFGELRIISTKKGGDIELFNFELLNNELFLEVIKVVTKNDKDFNYINNFVRAKYVDPIETLLYDFLRCVSSLSLSVSEKLDITDLGFDNLEGLTTKEAKRVELRAIINRIFLLDPTILQMNPQEVLQCAKSDSNKERRALANLYILSQNAYCYYSGIKVAREYKIAKAREYGMTQNRINNRTYLGVTNRFILTIDEIASLVRSEYNHIYNFTMDFYDKLGFGSTRTSTIGDNAKAFQNLYRRNQNDELLMEFRNPYEQDSLSPLSNAERKYLKLVLFEFAKIRSLIYGFDFAFNRFNLEDPKLIEFINKNKSWYFNVPLEKASDATRRTLPISQRIDNWKDLASRLLHNPKAAFDEFVLKFDTAEEAEMMELSFDFLSLHNKYTVGDGYKGGESSRNEILSSHPNGYFETNVENLLAHYLEKNIQVKELNKTLIGVKGTLLLLAMIGEAGNDSQNSGVKLTIKMTEDYIKLNVFNISLMEPESLKIMAWVYPFRKAVSSAYIAGNIVSMFRDTFEGMWQNTARMLIKYLTNINAKSLTRAYKEVTMASFTSIRGITIIDELCKTYRLSNLDVARISEGLTTSRGGLMNIENWMYATLRAPDFLNRMVLFVAKAMHDGSWEAFDLKDNKLIYNWKKDKRFSAYADPSKKGTPEWNELRIRYYNAIRLYNKEHPDNTIEYTDDLPVAYSNVEIQLFRQLSNSIYGAYDKSMRAKYENTALGLTFAMFSTWMNGLISNYFTKPGQYTDGITVAEQDTDGSGNLLYMDERGNAVIEIKQGDEVKYIYEQSGEEVENPKNLVPIMKNVPRVVQGIAYTFRDAFMCLKEGGLAEFKKEILEDPMQAANIRKALSDFLMMLLFYSLFRFGVSPLYKEYKKEMADHPAILNALIEVLYKSSSNSYDGFLGPVAALTYLGSKTNPPMFALSTKVTGDLTKFVLGDKTFGQLLSGNLALFRSFGDTYNAELKK